jgi:HPt (histidine-containing phosphotransfer) domain-containing protein
VTEPAPILDPRAFKRLTEWGGEALRGRIVALFLGQARERLDQVERGWAQQNLAEVERGAHSLKSSAANVGALALSEAAGKLERAAEDGDREEVAVLIPGFRKRLEEALEALEATGVASPLDGEEAR